MNDLSKISQSEHLSKMFTLVVDQQWFTFLSLVKHLLWDGHHADADKQVFFAITHFTDKNTLKRLVLELDSKERELWDQWLTDLEGKTYDLSDSYEKFSLKLKKTTLQSSGDTELDFFLSGLNIERLEEFIKTHEQLKNSLFYFLPSRLMSSLLNLYPADEIEQLLIKVKELQRPETKSLKDAFKSYFKDNFSAGGLHVDKISKFLSEDKRNIVLESLIRSKKFNMARNVAQEVIPSDIFMKLPSEILKAVTEGIDPKQKIEFLSILDEKERLQWIEAMMTVGTKAYEMIEMELEQILSNESDLKRLMKNHLAITTNFYTILRRNLVDEKYEQIRTELINEWIDSIIKKANLA